MPHRVIAIGDIHGCSNALNALLDVIEPGPDDLIVTLGDYVDRGPNSRGVLDRLIRLRRECQLVPLWGNHELMMLSAMHQPEEFEAWQASGGRATVLSYGGTLEQMPPEHYDFLAACVPFYETATHIFVHANYVPELPLPEQPPMALFWEHLTRRLPEPHISGKTAIVGHTPQHSGRIIDCGHVIGIDTYVFGGGLLTALDTLSGRLWQATRYGYAQEMKRR